MSETVTVLQYEGREIHLVGTAHISQKSVEEVQRVIADVKPDTVCVELDEARYKSMFDENQFRKLDIFQVIREKKVLFLLASLVLTSFQRRMGDRLGVKPGAELRQAVASAKELGAELVLADRNIQATLKRSWHNLSLVDRFKLMGAMTGSFFGEEEITEAQVEALKERDTINDAMQALAKEMPRLQIPLIDERDRFMMSAIQDAPGKKIVAVVGNGHVQGMIQYLGKEADREALSVIPTPSLLSRSIKWLIPALIVGAFFFSSNDRSGDDFTQMLYAWLIPNAVGAAVLSLVAGAKLLTALVAAIASPITSLNPLIGAGVVAALVEAKLRKPTVEDCEGINEALLSLKGMYMNSFTRVLLVFVGASLGSALGAYVGAFFVVKSM